MTRNILTVAAAIALNLAVATPAEAAAPEDHARTAAAESPQALRSFVHRTRMIYALDIRDFPTARDATKERSEAAETRVRDAQRRAEKERAELREQIYRDMLHE
jgi:hypothetical protein